MRYLRYRVVKRFYNDVKETLLRDEVQNMVPLGNVIIGNEGKDKTGWRDPANWYMATVSDEKGIRLTAVMTPPHNLTLYATDNVYDEEIIKFLIENIKKDEIFIGGVMTEIGLAKNFADIYSRASGMDYFINKNQRIYELKKISENIAAVKIRPVKETDMAFLPYWVGGFHSDCFGTELDPTDADLCRYFIASRNLFILEDAGTPVSMARILREMQNVAGVGSVYTPPYFRNNGYATGCVTAVSRLILERGFTKCALYTDLANPVSNGIYQKIGYEPVCDSVEIIFKTRDL